MNRRDFSALSLATSAALGLPLAARAQGAPAEGAQYTRLAQPVPVAASGKIDVAEFFWYGCPHCSALEPEFDAWVRKQPADVQVRRVPVGFTPSHEFHQKLFFALEALGLLDSLHRKVFNAIHVERKRLNTEADVLAFAAANGVDGAKLVETMKSFSVIGKARQAKQLTEAWRLDGVPAIGVQGKFLTSPALTGSHAAALAVTDYLVAQARKARG